MSRLGDYIDLSGMPRRTPIPELIEKAKTQIRAKGYSQNAIWKYNERFNDLKRCSELFGTKRLTKRFILWLIEEGAQRHRKHARGSSQRKALLNVIASAVGSPPVFTYGKEADAICSGSLRKSLSDYEQHLKDQDKRKGTMGSYLRIATKLLLYLEKTGHDNMTKVTAADIQGFVMELGTRWSSRSMQTVPSPLRGYLKFAGVEADALLAADFSVPRKSKPVRAMSTETVDALWEYVEGDGGDLRAKAIVIMLLVTGIRPVDIANLKLDDIDWESPGRISFVQSKTDVRMTIELFPVMGSAIARYLIEQRPRGTGQEYVFLTKTSPYRKIPPAVCTKDLKSAMEEAGVAYLPDGLHCPRALRRSLVSRMIAKGVAVQKAAAALGHVGEGSVDLYIELDTEKMRSICLPIPDSMKNWLVLS